MRYITNADNYLVTVSFGGDVECDWGYCTEYEGRVPTGYTSLEAWYAEEVEKLHRWKIVNGQLTMDAGAVAPRQCNSLVDMVYPVGSIYLAYNHTNPADLFGGTWARITGAFLWATDKNGTIGETGGEKTHTLTVDEMPSHNHTKEANNVLSSGLYYQRVALASASSESYGTTRTDDTGGGKAHNNMPPYIKVSVWRRTA